MSESVIYMLEIVQIYINKCSRATAVYCIIYESAKILLASHSVIKTREKIIIGLRFHLLLITLFLCYIV